MIDPLIAKIIATGFGLLWLGAAWHKLAAPTVFRGILKDYQLLPTVLLGLLSYLVPVIEAALGVSWLLGLATVKTSIISAVLLSSYALAIAINLLRGRVHIDCGCGFSSAATEHPLSWMLVVRNFVLIVISLLLLLPVGERVLGWSDYIVLATALLVTLLLQGAVSQLLRNGAAIGAWRSSHD